MINSNQRVLVTCLVGSLDMGSDQFKPMMACFVDSVKMGTDQLKPESVQCSWHIGLKKLLINSNQKPLIYLLYLVFTKDV